MPYAANFVLVSVTALSNIDDSGKADEKKGSPTTHFLHATLSSLHAHLTHLRNHGRISSFHPALLFTLGLKGVGPAPNPSPETGLEAVPGLN